MELCGLELTNNLKSKLKAIYDDGLTNLVDLFGIKQWVL